MPTIAETILARRLKGTLLSSREIREKWSAELRRQSFFSARVSEGHVLGRIRECVARIASGQGSDADAQLEISRALRAAGVGSDGGGGVADPGSLARVRLIRSTQVEMASSQAMMARSEAPGIADDWPAWALVRMNRANVPRNWLARWDAAGRAVGWKGALRSMNGARFLALKSSPIWAALGRGEGGFSDTLGNPFPPFAFNSGMEWEEVDAEEAREAGLLKEGE